MGFVAEPHLRVTWAKRPRHVSLGVLHHYRVWESYYLILNNLSFGPGKSVESRNIIDSWSLIVTLCNTVSPCVGGKRSNGELFSHIQVVRSWTYLLRRLLSQYGMGPLWNDLFMCVIEPKRVFTNGSAKNHHWRTVLRGQAARELD